MRVNVLITSGMLICAGMAPGAAGQGTGATRGHLTPGTWAITDVTVIPMTADTVITGATVLVRDGRIAAVGRGVPMPNDARRIDGRGRFVIPGLADMHTHLYSDEDLADSLAPAELGVMLANGVTTIRLMIGTPEQLTLRHDVAAGRVLGPQLWVASPQLNGRQATNSIVVTTPDEARAAVQPEVGVRRALTTGQQIEHLDSYFETVLADSAPMMESLTQQRVYQLGQWVSLDYIDDRKIAAIADATARAGVWSVPTLHVFNAAFAIGESEESIRARPDWQLVPEKSRALYLRVRARYWSDSTAAVRTDARRRRYGEVRNQLVKRIHDAGGRILAGSDSPEWFHVYGWALHRELQALVSAGLTPYQALLTATRRPAEFMGELAQWGTLERGKRADLVLLAANPLRDIRHTTQIDGVAIGGRWLDKAQLAEMIRAGGAAVTGR